MKRKAYLDNLKLFLTLLVIFHHAGQAHMEGAFWPRDRWINVCRILYFEPARYPQYVIMFIVGLLASRRSALENISDKSGITCLGVGLLLAAGNYLRAGGVWNDFQADTRISLHRNHHHHTVICARIPSEQHPIFPSLIR